MLIRAKTDATVDTRTLLRQPISVSNNWLLVSIRPSLVKAHATGAPFLALDEPSPNADWWIGDYRN